MSIFQLFEIIFFCRTEKSGDNKCIFGVALKMVRNCGVLKIIFSEIFEGSGKLHFFLATFWLHYGSIMERSHNRAKNYSSTFP